MTRLSTRLSAVLFAISVLFPAPCVALLLSPLSSSPRRSEQSVQATLSSGLGAHSHGPKYAIIATWVQQPVVRTPSEIAKFACPLALSLRSVANTSRAALPSATRASTTIDEVLYTDMNYFGTEARDFMEARGVRVVDIGRDPFIQGVEQQQSNNPYYTGNAIKLAFLWATEYDAIIAVDWDVLWPAPSGLVDLLGLVAASDAPIVGFGTGNGSSPIAGGILAVRPSQDFKLLYSEALHHGFSVSDGFGGDYAADLNDILAPYHAKWCFDSICTVPKPCCKLDYDSSPWCFAGSDNDQGFLVHLAYTGQQHRYQELAPLWTDLGFFQTPTSPKPWETDSPLFSTSETERHFWDLWQGGQSRLLEHDWQCTAFYEGKLHYLAA